MKKIVLMALLGVFASVAQADYLYWQIAPNAYGEATYDNANVIVLNTATGERVATLSSWWGDDEWGTDIPVSPETGMPVNYLAADVTGYEDYSFIIELSNYGESGNTFVAMTDTPQTYASLSGNIGTGKMTDVPSVSVWHGGTFNIPEPTSGLLALCGFAVLSLRRKRFTNGGK